NVLATAHHAAGGGRPDHTIHQSAALHRHLRTGGNYSGAHSLHQRALVVARAARDTAGELPALTALGVVDRLQGRNGPAATCLGQAIDLARDIGSLTGEIDALNALGQVYYVQGAHGSAADCHARALRLAHTTGSRSGELNALT